jgi:hypothetical protein
MAASHLKTAFSCPNKLGHLSMNAPGGENLESAIDQRESVKKILKGTLISVKAIDDSEYNGLYIKDDR